MILLFQFRIDILALYIYIYLTKELIPSFSRNRSNDFIHENICRIDLQKKDTKQTYFSIFPIFYTNFPRNIRRKINVRPKFKISWRERGVRVISIIQINTFNNNQLHRELIKIIVNPENNPRRSSSLFLHKIKSPLISFRNKRKKTSKSLLILGEVETYFLA